MTPEQKAKAYDEVIGKAAALYKASEPMSGCNVIIETLFPELAESEDERIIKAIKSAVLQLTDIYLQEKYGLKQSDCIAWLEKQKPIEWSEEDDSRYSSCLYMVERETSLYNWLKSLKERVLPQPKQEWSEEDEQILQGIWDEILANKHDAKECEWKTYDKFLDWLKSLRPHNR